MFDFTPYVIMALQTVLYLAIGLLLVRKLQNMIPETVENFKEDAKTELEKWLNSEQGQKALYFIGGLIGNGAATGLGMGKKGGKFKFEDIIGELAVGFLRGNLPVTGQSQASPPPSKPKNELHSA